jgi:hypothetical protein
LGMETNMGRFKSSKLDVGEILKGNLERVI